MERGRLIVISGPSGTGKGTIIRKVMERLTQTEFSISMTTRPPRPGEENGREYLFVEENAFRAAIDQDGFLEWAQVYGHYYGTPKEQIQQRLEAGRDVILDIDVQGGASVRQAMPAALMIFILPPSMEELRRRITQRATDDPAVIERRMQEAMGEIRQLEDYDYVIVNDDLDRAVEEAVAILTASRCQVGQEAPDIIRKYEEEISCSTHPSTN